MARLVGIIITVSVLIAAGLAAYENPQVRQWINRSRKRIAMALHSLGDDIHPRSTSPREDPSMREEASELAEARRMQVRADILARGRILEERMKRRRSASDKSDRGKSFDTIVDKDGMLRKDDIFERENNATTTAIEPHGSTSTFLSRQVRRASEEEPLSMDLPTLQQLEPRPDVSPSQEDPFTNAFEQEMRSTWNIPVTERQSPTITSHGSMSLIDLTPMTDVAQDPEVSIPATINAPHTLERSEYFSVAGSLSSRSPSTSEPDFYYAHPDNPFEPVPPRTIQS